MTVASIQDLHERADELVDLAAGGEVVTVTRDGRAVAELHALPAEPRSAAALLEQWRGLPSLDADALRADLDATIDSKLSL